MIFYREANRKSQVKKAQENYYMAFLCHSCIDLQLHTVRRWGILNMKLGVVDTVGTVDAVGT